MNTQSSGTKTPVIRIQENGNFRSLGIMLAITFEIHNMLYFMDQDNDKNPISVLAFNKLFEEFVSQYKKLELKS